MNPRRVLLVLVLLVLPFVVAPYTPPPPKPAWDAGQFGYGLRDLSGTPLPESGTFAGVYLNRARAVHLTEVCCEVDGGTTTIQLVRRSTGGTTNVLPAPLTCGTAVVGVAPATGCTHTLAADALLMGQALDHVTVSNESALRISVTLRYRVD